MNQPAIDNTPTLILIIIAAICACFCLSSCETIPIKAQACYVQNGVRVCTGYSTSEGISLDASFAKGKK